VLCVLPCYEIHTWGDAQGTSARGPTDRDRRATLGANGESAVVDGVVATMPGRVREVIKAQSTSVESRRVSPVQQDDLLGLLFDKQRRKIDHASYSNEQFPNTPSDKGLSRGV